MTITQFDQFINDYQKTPKASTLFDDDQLFSTLTEAADKLNKKSTKTTSAYTLDDLDPANSFDHALFLDMQEEKTQSSTPANETFPNPFDFNPAQNDQIEQISSDDFYANLLSAAEKVESKTPLMSKVSEHTQQWQEKALNTSMEMSQAIVDALPNNGKAQQLLDQTFASIEALRNNTDELSSFLPEVNLDPTPATDTTTTLAEPILKQINKQNTTSTRPHMESLFDILDQDPIQLSSKQIQAETSTHSRSAPIYDNTFRNQAGQNWGDIVNI